MDTRWCRPLLACGLLLPALALRLHLDPHTGIHLRQAIGELKAQTWSNGDLCLTVDGPFMGRLSNTVSMMNTVLDVAVSTNVRFVFPSKYTRFMENEGFSELFGREAECPSHLARQFRPTCAFDEGERYRDRWGRCQMDNLRLNTTTGGDVWSASCNCGRIIAVNSSLVSWDHDYTRTHGILRERFWRGRFGQQSSGGLLQLRSPRPQVAVHMRLGDIEFNCSGKFSEYNCQKRLKAELYCQTFRALFTVLPAYCVDVSIHTDGTRESRDVVQVMECLTKAGVVPSVLARKSISTQRSFSLLVGADVLVFGSSGYGQVAAVLAHSTTARVGAPMPQPYFSPDPLGFLPNVTQLSLAEGSPNISIAEAVGKLAQNAAIQALVARCRVLPQQFSGSLNAVNAIEESVDWSDSEARGGSGSESRDLFES